MLEDAAGGEPRPTVPVKLAAVPRGKAAGQENPPDAEGQEAAEGASVAAEAPEKFDPFKADPSLERLRQNWGNLKRWEDMTMEERRETFGYVANTPGESNAAGAAAPGPGRTEVSATSA